jgi:hypothetical protein
MWRSIAVLGLLGVGIGCGSRAASTSDAQAVEDTGAHRDRPAQDGRTGLDATTVTCSSLSVVGQVGLEQADTMKFGPQVAFDGERFAVVWHSQPGIAMVDAAGKTSTPDGVKLGPDNGIIPASLVPAANDYAILHMQISAGAEPGVELRHVNADGLTLGTTAIKGLFYQAAMTTHPSGHAVFLAVQSGSPELVVVGSSGSVSSPKILGSAQVMSSLWLAPRPGGFAAAWSSTNKNGTLHVLDPTFNILKQTGVGHGASITSPSFAVMSNGFAAVYVAYGNQVESEVYDGSGERLGHQTLSPAGTPITATSQTALVWNGKQLFAVYAGAVGGQYVVQVLDGSGVPTSKSVQLPNCLATAHGISAAWGGNQLAVAAINEASGVMASTVCVTLMGCL